MSRAPRGTHGCSVWKGIFSGWDIFHPHLKLVAGLGMRTLFWHDNWGGDIPLKVMFPVLFSCSSSQAASVASCLSASNVGVGRTWNITFIRALMIGNWRKCWLFSILFSLRFQPLSIWILCFGSFVSMGSSM